jgi:hypothetical protein
MDVLVDTLIRTLPEKNSIKEKMSIAYIHGLNTTVNYAVNDASRDVDGMGIDMTIYSRSVGVNRSTASEANQIHIQLKGVSISSGTMYKDLGNSIQYTLSKDIRRVGPAHYFIMVVLPAEDKIDIWREIDEDTLILHAKAYYLHIETILKKGKIIIPKSNKLTTDSYRQLFDAANDKDAI